MVRGAGRPAAVGQLDFVELPAGLGRGRPLLQAVLVLLLAPLGRVALDVAVGDGVGGDVGHVGADQVVVATVAVTLEGELAVQVTELAVLGGGEADVQGLLADGARLGGEGRVVTVVEPVDGAGAADAVGPVVVVIVVLVHVAVLQLQVAESPLHLADVVAEEVLLAGRVVVGLAVRMREAAAVLGDVVDGGLAADEVQGALW